MNKTSILLLALFTPLLATVHAQDTNSLKTVIGVFETRTDEILIRGFDQIGSVVVGPDTISVRTKASTDLATGQTVYGLAIQIDGSPLPRERALIDDSEIDPLLDGMDYLIKIKYDASALPSFEACFTTKAGLKIAANSIRREGGIQHSLQYGDHPRIFLSSLQMSQLYVLVEQARKNLEALKAPK